MEEEKEFKFTEGDFNYLREVVKKETGIISDESKYTMYYSRLSRRLRKLSLPDFVAYRQYLADNLSTESIELVNAVTTNLTAFYREAHHFKFLVDTLIAEKIKNNDKVIRIWSAACSTGEEAYSIAMTLIDTIKDIEQWDIKIYATDIDSNVVKTAKTGVYSLERISGLDDKQVKQHMKKGSGANNGFIKINESVKSIIRFNQMNLLKPWPIKEKMDVIFCRNVVIYFDKETKTDLVNRFYDLLKSNGYLLMGHSESLHGISERYLLLGKTIYQKEA